MSTAREAVLARVREALADRPEEAAVAAASPSAFSPIPEPLDLFVSVVADYGATVVVADDPRGAVEEALASRGARRVGVAADLDATLCPRDVEVVADADLSSRELDTLDAVVTTSAAACAETGTIAFDGGPGQGRRALTLVPDVHVCVVERSRIVGGLDELLALLEPSAREGRPLVLVSGPSATSDIELDRVEGVHGPRTLVVIVSP